MDGSVKYLFGFVLTRYLLLKFNLVAFTSSITNSFSKAKLFVTSSSKTEKDTSPVESPDSYKLIVR